MWQATEAEIETVGQRLQRRQRLSRRIVAASVDQSLAACLPFDSHFPITSFFRCWAEIVLQIADWMQQQQRDVSWKQISTDQTSYCGCHSNNKNIQKLHCIDKQNQVIEKRGRIRNMYEKNSRLFVENIFLLLSDFIYLSFFLYTYFPNCQKLNLIPIEEYPLEYCYKIIYKYCIIYSPNE